MNYRIVFLFLSSIVMILLCADSYAMQSHIGRIKEFEKQFSHVAIYPVHYFSFVRELKLQTEGASELTERWDMELAANNNKDAVLYALPSQPQSVEYRELSFNLLGKDGKQLILPIEYATFNYEEFGKVKKILSLPFVRIPASSKHQRVIVQFKMRIKDKGITSGKQQLELTHSIPVDTAELILTSSVIETSNISVESNGFDVKTKPTEGMKFVRNFVLKEKWFPINLKPTIPKVHVSLTTWPDIALVHGQFYQHELDRKLGLSFSSLNISMKSLDQKNPERTRQIAHDLYKWMGDNFTYAYGVDRNPEFFYKPRPLDESFRQKKGDCKNFALAYIKLLSFAGITAEPVEVAIDDFSGSPQPIPSTLAAVGQFNHVIVYIPELDMYVDPTVSNPALHSSSNFALHSTRYANTYGLHLFSKRLALIRPDGIRKEIKVKTKIQKVNDEWLGTTTWLGKNSSHETLTLIQERRAKLIKEGKKFDRAFLKNNLIERPASWVFDRDDLYAKTTVGFSYSFKRAPVDTSGKLLQIPLDIMASALFRFDADVEFQTNGNFCFGSELSEEEIEIDGVKAARFPPQLRNAHVVGINSDYLQTILVTGDKLVLKRRFLFNEKRASCSDTEVAAQEKFYKEIRDINTKTHALVE